jgi:hypothetical protein
MRLSLRALVGAVLAAAQAASAGGEPQVLELEDGARIEYVLYRHAPDAHLRTPPGPLSPDSALHAAMLLHRLLSTGDLEEAALLSNAPRRRFEVLRDYRQEVGEEEFRRVFDLYGRASNRLVAEIAIGRHRLLVWELPTEGEAPHYAGQYFVELGGRWFLDDVPGQTRALLRRVLQAYRAGRLRP